MHDWDPATPASSLPESLSTPLVNQANAITIRTIFYRAFRIRLEETQTSVISEAVPIPNIALESCYGSMTRNLHQLPHRRAS